jgi:hypothetical protein
LVQNVWATLCRRFLHASSRTTTKAAPHTQYDGCWLRYGYMGTHPSRRSRYGWLEAAERCLLCGVFAAGFGSKIPNFAIQPFLGHRNAWKERRLAEKRLRNGWMIGSHQPPTVVNRWRCGVRARVVLELAIVVANCGAFGAAPPEGLKAKRTRK